MSDQQVKPVQHEKGNIKNEQMFVHFIKQMPIPLCIINNINELEFINDRFIKAFGYLHEDIPTLDDWWQNAFPDPIYREWAISNWNNALSKTDSKGDLGPDIYKITCKNGSIKHIRTEVITIQETVLVTFHDITLELIAKKELDEKEIKLNNIINEIDIVVYTIDKEGIFTFSEGKGLELLGLKPGQVVGLSAFEVYKDYPVIVDNVKRALKGEQVKSNLTVGAAIFETTLTPVLDKNGQLDYIIGASLDVSNSEHFKSKLKESENRFKEIFNAVNEGIIIANDDGKLVEVNDTACKMYGYSKEEILQMHPTDFIHSSGHSNYKYFMQEIESVGRFEGENKEQRKDGSTYNSYVVGTKVMIEGKTHLLVSIRDITKRKEAQQERDNIFNSTLALLCTANMNGYLENVNPAFEKTLGWTVEELRSKPFIEFIHPDDRQATLEEAAKINEGHSAINFINRYQSKDGSYRTLNWQTVPFEGKMYGSAVDITELKSREQDLHETLERLRKSNEELEQFAYVSSHDLQEPLRKIKNYIDLLELKYNDQFDESAHKYMNIITSGAERMQQLINDLLQLSRISTQGKEFEEVNLNTVVHEIIELFELTINENNANIAYEKLPGIRADKRQIAQLFQNLISNALKFRGDNNPEISIRAEEEQKHFIISVKDNGIGFDPKFADRVFIVFQRLHNREEYIGTGIGLAICKKIVERHSGQIWVETEPGKGSTFFIRIPK